MSANTTVDIGELRELIADVLDIEAGSITEDVDFVHELGVDSLLALELAVTLERRYGITIESHEVVDVQTMHDVRDLLSRKVQSRG